MRTRPFDKLRPCGMKGGVHAIRCSTGVLGAFEFPRLPPSSPDLSGRRTDFLRLTGFWNERAEAEKRREAEGLTSGMLPQFGPHPPFHWPPRRRRSSALKPHGGVVKARAEDAEGRPIDRIRLYEKWEEGGGG